MLCIIPTSEYGFNRRNFIRGLHLRRVFAGCLVINLLGGFYRTEDRVLGRRRVVRPGTLRSIKLLVRLDFFGRSRARSHSV